MVHFSSYLLVVSIIVGCTLNYAASAGENTTDQQPPKSCLWPITNLFKKTKKSEKQEACEKQLEKCFGKKCVEKDDPVLCADRAMLALKLLKLPEGVAKMYFELLGENILSNNLRSTDEFCNDRLLKLDRDINYILDLLRSSDIQKTAGDSFLKDITIRFHKIIGNKKEECGTNLQIFKNLDSADIFKETFENIILIDFKNTDEIDYFINYIFKKFKIYEKAQRPKKFCSNDAKCNDSVDHINV